MSNKESIQLNLFCEPEDSSRYFTRKNRLKIKSDCDVLIFDTDFPNLVCYKITATNLP